MMGRLLVFAVLICLFLGGVARPQTNWLVREWRAASVPGQKVGMRHLSGADGLADSTSVGGSACIRARRDASPPSIYLYFDVLASFDTRGGPLYVVVEYFDAAPLGSILLQYDSALGEDLDACYRPAEAQAGGWRTGRRIWRTAMYRLGRPRLAGRQNLGADFRLHGSELIVRSVRLQATRPEGWEKLAAMPAEEIKPLVKIGPGGQLIVGGFDVARRQDAGSQIAALQAAIPSLKSLGVTSHELYIRWNLCETEPNRFDWSVYDRFVALYKKHGLKWVPFLIAGSAYSLPRWYYKQPGSAGYVCLEHGLESDVQSLWNPELRKHVARFIAAFCDRYRDSGVIETILLGVTGNYGEAIYPVTGNDWTADIYGPYHSHPGFWCGDRYAVESFRNWLGRKYGGSSPLRDAWGERAPLVGQAKPFLRRDAPNERAWLDLCDWYIGSMTAWSRFWLRETRKHFPKGDIQLCTGGHAPPEHGADFGEQCRIAAEIGGGVRITNEASDPGVNFSLTRWVASAGRQYGAHYSFEPAGEVNAKGVIARIFNATASGARGLHYYSPNLFGTEDARINFVRWGAEFRQREPFWEIAVYYPQTHIKLNGNDFLSFVQPLRDRFDFCYRSDRQILDGGLRSVKVLILLHGNIAEAGVWRAITEWIRSGGVLIYPEEMGPLATVERDLQYHDALFGRGARLGRGRVVLAKGLLPGRVEYRQFVTEALRQSGELSGATRSMLRLDGTEDDVFVAACLDEELVWLNFTAQVQSRAGTRLAPFSITTTRLSRNPQFP